MEHFPLGFTTRQQVFVGWTFELQGFETERKEKLRGMITNAGGFVVSESVSVKCLVVPMHWK